MSSTLRVNVYQYPNIVHIGSKKKAQIDQDAQNIASTLFATSSLFLPVFVNPMMLEHCNRRYTEKQVKRIDENFYDYSLGTKYALNVPSQTPPKRLRYLIEKFFSGDVSGDIGEALFAYFMTIVMNIPSSNVGHTRPEKRKGFLSPDFVVWDNSFQLSSLLKRPSFQLPVIAEVKGFTGPIDSLRISHALYQLKRVIAHSSLPGILFLSVRNQTRQGYDAFIIEVEK